VLERFEPSLEVVERVADRALGARLLGARLVRQALERALEVVALALELDERLLGLLARALAGVGRLDRGAIGELVLDATDARVEALERRDGPS
jgi:hypothetical protein